MSYLLYCIFRQREGLTPSPLYGVDDRPILLIEQGGLTAAISAAPADPAPDSSRAMAYARVIEALHRSSLAAGVIPMRYGTHFAGEPQIIRFLTDHGREHAALLQEVEGCEEMGIRLLLPAPAPPFVQPPPQQGEVPTAPEGPAGRAYLAARRARYAEAAKVTEEMQHWVECCRRSLSGLFVKSVDERRAVCDPQTQTPKALLSLYFLVPRACLPPFRRQFRKLHATVPAQLLLSGPWPPYNFVLPKPAAAERAGCSV